MGSVTVNSLSPEVKRQRGNLDLATAGGAHVNTCGSNLRLEGLTRIRGSSEIRIQYQNMTNYLQYVLHEIIDNTEIKSTKSLQPRYNLCS